MAAAASAMVAFWPASVASQATADSLPASASSFPSAHGAAGISQAQISEGNFALRQREVAALVARQAVARQAAARQRAAARAAAAAAAQQQAQQQQAQQQAPQPAPSQAAPVPSGSAQQIAMSMLGSYGWSSGQFSCLDSLWNEESGWNVFASNPTSGAYGIPQALPGSKMASAGPDWQSDAATQIRWGLGYIQSVYGSPCGAWAHEQADGWY
jgi:type II secretory pathway pseudopilin PulG